MEGAEKRCIEEVNIPNITRGRGTLELTNLFNACNQIPHHSYTHLPCQSSCNQSHARFCETNTAITHTYRFGFISRIRFVAENNEQRKICKYT